MVDVIIVVDVVAMTTDDVMEGIQLRGEANLVRISATRQLVDRRQPRFRLFLHQKIPDIVNVYEYSFVLYEEDKSMWRRKEKVTES